MPTEKSTDDRIKRVQPAKDPVRQVQNRKIINDELQTDGPVRHVVDDDGYTAESPGKQMMRYQEKIEAQASDQTAQTDDQVPLDLLLHFF